MPTPVIHAEELVSKLDRVVLLDVRSVPDARGSYDAGHLPGARFVDLEHDLATHRDPKDGGRHPLPSPQEFGVALGRLGVTASTEVVAYDLAAGANAASRLWWMLRAIGHERVRVLDGLPATWERADLRMTRDPVEFEPAPAYVASEYRWPTADIDAVDAARTDAARLVLDARSRPRFRGEMEPIDPIAGHVPGAKNLFHLSLTDADGRLLEANAIADAVAAVAGDVPLDRAIVHCGSGVTACHLMLAIEHAGLSRPTLYVGSWSEWCRNERPRATIED